MTSLGGEEKILVTGGSGFIGSYLVSRLVKLGHEVTVLDNNFRGSTENLSNVSDEIIFVEGDILDKPTVRGLTEDKDRIYHLAAINGTKNFYEIPTSVLDVNIKGTLNVIEAVKNSEVERLIFPSSSEVYGFPLSFPTHEDHILQIMNPENPRYSYAGSKIIGEIYLINSSKNSDFNYTILRPHNLYGPRMGYDHVIPEFIERIVKRREFTIHGSGEQTRSFCYITDAVDGIIKAGFKDEGTNEIFNIGNNEEEIPIKELAERLFDIAGVNPEIKYTESKELEGSPKRRLPDISKARNLLDYSPEISLQEGLEKTYEWYREDFLRNA